MSELSSLYSNSPCCLLEQLQGGNSQPAQQSAHHQGAGVYKGSHRETEPASQYLLSVAVLSMSFKATE